MMKKNMPIHTEVRSGVMVISPIGEFSKNSSNEMREIIVTAVDDGTTKIVFDFSALGQISSDGLRVILEAVKIMRNINGQIAIVDLAERVRAVFEVGGFFSLLEEFENIGRVCNSWYVFFNNNLMIDRYIYYCHIFLLYHYFLYN